MLYACYCKTSHNTLPNTLQVFTPSESPNNSWGAKWPGGLTDPSCPGEEERRLADGALRDRGEDKPANEADENANQQDHCQVKAEEPQDSEELETVPWHPVHPQCSGLWRWGTHHKEQQQN